jgi:Protein of unknown function (DUF2924)
MRKTLRLGQTRTARPPLESAAKPIGAEAPSIARGLDAELAELERFSLDDLRLRWRNNWGRLAPAHLSRTLLFRVMAYRLQAEAFDDLDRKIIRLLDRLATIRRTNRLAMGRRRAAAMGTRNPGSRPHEQPVSR